MLNSLKELHWTIYLLAFASTVIWTGFAMLLPLLPVYGEQLSFNEFEIGLIVASFFIGRVLFQFPLGILSDHFGRRLIMLVSLALFAVTTAAYAMTTYAPLMVALRLLQGMASSGFAVGSTAYVNDMTPAGLRGLAAGVMSSAINAGIIAGPIIGGTFSGAFDIQAPFWLGGFLGALTFFMCLAIPALDERSAKTFWQAPAGIKQVKQLLEPILCRPTLSFSLIHFLQMTSLTIFLSAAPILTAAALDWSPNDIAVALAVGGTAAVLSSPFWGQLSDRSGHLRILLLGLVLMALEGALVFFHPGAPLTLLAFILGGLGAPAYFNAFNAMIGDATDASERGSVTGFVGSFGEWGSIVGSGLIMPLAWRYISVEAPMALDVAVLLAAVLLALALRGPLRQQIGRARVSNC